MLKKLFLAVCVLAIFAGSNALIAKEKAIDWNELDGKYSYTAASPGLAVGLSILPVWSGSFDAGFSGTGLLYTLGKTACAVGVGYGLGTGGGIGTSVAALSGLALAALIGYDMHYSYNFVVAQNAKYAYTGKDRYNEYIANQKTKESRQRREQTQLLAFGLSHNF